MTRWGRSAVAGMVRGAGFLIAAWVVAAPATAQAQWRDASSGFVPRFATPSGYEASGQSLFVCRSAFEGGIHPGKLRRDFGGCNIAFGGREYTLDRYQVWMGDGWWVEAGDGVVPPGMVQAGYEADGQPLGACRARLGRGLHLGKIREGFGGCNIPFDGLEETVPVYEVLMN